VPPELLPVLTEVPSPELVPVLLEVPSGAGAGAARDAGARAAAEGATGARGVN